MLRRYLLLRIVILAHRPPTGSDRHFPKNIERRSQRYMRVSTSTSLNRIRLPCFACLPGVNFIAQMRLLPLLLEVSSHCEAIISSCVRFPVSWQRDRMHKSSSSVAKELHTVLRRHRIKRGNQSSLKKSSIKSIRSDSISLADCLIPTI